MRAALRYERVRLTTLRSTWALIGLGVLASALGTVAYSSVVWLMADGGYTVTPAEAFMVTVTQPSLVPVVAGLLGVLSIAGDRRHGTLTTAVLAEPRRLLVGLSKATAILILAVPLNALVIAVNWGVSRLVLSEGHAYAPSVGGALWVLASMLIVTVGWTAVGVAIGMLVQSHVVAVAVLLIVPFGLERALTSVALLSGGEALARLVEHLPFQAADSIKAMLPVDNPVIISSGLGTGMAIIVFITFAGALFALAAGRFARADLGGSA